MFVLCFWVSSAKLRFRFEMFNKTSFVPETSFAELDLSGASLEDSPNIGFCWGFRVLGFVLLGFADKVAFLI